MSQSAALHDPVFRAYLWILLALLAGAGGVLGILQIAFGRNLESVWRTYRSWLVMAPLAALAIFAGRVPFILGLSALALAGTREFARVARLDRWTCSAVSLGIVVIACTALFGLPQSVPTLGFLLILLVPILRNRIRGAVHQMSLGVICFLYLGWMLGQLGFLANTPHAYGYLCFVIFATEVCDVAAFTFGKIFGRHPLRSEISPRKTWEGALGALLVALILPWLLRFSFPFFGPVQLLLAGLIVGVGGQLGDLSLSVLKRDLGTKDIGSSIPGHGGILDRIDSLIFTAPLFMVLATYYHPGP